jgi:hypothetical protein
LFASAGRRSPGGCGGMLDAHHDTRSCRSRRSLWVRQVEFRPAVFSRDLLVLISRWKALWECLDWRTRKRGGYGVVGNRVAEHHCPYPVVGIAHKACDSGHQDTRKLNVWNLLLTEPRHVGFLGHKLETTRCGPHRECETFQAPNDSGQCADTWEAAVYFHAD